MKAHERVLLVSREPQGGQIEQWRAMSHACSSLIGDHRKTRHRPFQIPQI
jgi:hypothetical protein